MDHVVLQHQTSSFFAVSARTLDLGSHLRGTGILLKDATWYLQCKHPVNVTYVYIYSITHVANTNWGGNESWRGSAWASNTTPCA